MELWKDIIGYDGWYQISNKGNVKSKRKVLKPKLEKKGYYRITLWKNDKSKTFLIHRLVAIHFIDNPNQYEQVNHIDFNPLNNDVNNLEWCTNKQNFNHSFLAGRITKGSTNGKSKLHEKEVLVIKNLLNNKISCSKIAKRFNVSPICIHNIKSGRTWNHV